MALNNQALCPFQECNGEPRDTLSSLPPIEGLDQQTGIRHLMTNGVMRKNKGRGSPEERPPPLGVVVKEALQEETPEGESG